MPDNHVIAMLADEGGRKYALLASGLVECMGKTIKELPAMPGKRAGAGIAVSGRIYAAGAEKGLYVFTGSGNWEQDSFYTERKVLHLAKSDRGQVLAVAADGIYRGSSGNWEKIKLDPMPADFVPLKYFRDHQGKLWITGTSGRIQGGARSALVTVQNKQLVSLAAPLFELELCVPEPHPL